MALLFFHGAGGYDDDLPLASGIAAALGTELIYPALPTDDWGYEDWAAPIRRRVDAVAPDDLVVAHSFGASVLLRVLAERPRTHPARAVLLAMPEWSEAGWDVADYAFRGPEPATTLSLHHCRDDDVVPFEHIARNAALLPSATRHEHAVGGHQFDGLAAVIAVDVAPA
ncbi:alpha/beta hydrolase [Microbacterium sp. W1N]|uniref:alpha/beta hydrolase n=1 Tax=Microbacterium festucae TaxID=2977531 RepID=UPI0021BF9054|nr:alpha/beta hydrolase [Microbacterium festucae]MCT9819510.1 alpha/beta hydrolase [Microbacterium festucae]